MDNVAVVVEDEPAARKMTKMKLVLKALTRVRTPVSLLSAVRMASSFLITAAAPQRRDGEHLTSYPKLLTPSARRCRFSSMADFDEAAMYSKPSLLAPAP